MVVAAFQNEVTHANAEFTDGGCARARQRPRVNTSFLTFGRLVFKAEGVNARSMLRETQVKTINVGSRRSERSVRAEHGGSHRLSDRSEVTPY